MIQHQRQLQNVIKSLQNSRLNPNFSNGKPCTRLLLKSQKKLQSEAEQAPNHIPTVLCPAYNNPIVPMCIRFQTILFIVIFFLENQLRLLAFMYLAGRCQRCAQKQLLTLSGSIFMNSARIPAKSPF